MYEDIKFLVQLEELYELKFRQFLTSKSTGHRSPMSKVLARYYKYQLGELKPQKLRRKKAARKRSNSAASTKPSAVHKSVKTGKSNKSINSATPNTNTEAARATNSTKALTATTANEASKIDASEINGDNGGLCWWALQGFVGCFSGCFRRGRD